MIKTTVNRVLIPNVFQDEALNILKNTKETKGIIVLPTGTGKTYLSALWFREILSREPKARLLFICHNSDILSQANEKEFKNCLKELKIPYGYYRCNEKDIRQTTFATVQTLSRNLRKFKEDSFDYIIVDEVHHYQAKTFKKVIEYFKPKFLLGLTATPYRMDGLKISDICGKILYKGEIKDAILKNLLTKIIYYCVDDNLDFSKIKFKNGKYDRKDLNKKLCIEKYDELILKEYLKNEKKFKRKKAIGFCATVEHAERMAKLFNDNGISAISLCGYKTKKIKTKKGYISKKLHFGYNVKRNRGKLLDDFRNGKYKIIFVRDLFNEGIDIPDADFVLMLRPTDSHTIFTQQLGRGLRKSIGKKNLLVLDFIGNAKRCHINFEVLSEVFGFDLKKAFKSGGKSGTREIILESLGNIIRLSKSKINILNSKDQFYIRQEILDKYKEYRKLKSEHFGKEDFCKRYHISKHKINRLFGSWNKMRVSAGEDVKVRNRFVWNKDLLVKVYNNLKRKLGYPPSAQDIIKEKGINISNYNKMFGSWNKFKGTQGDTRDRMSNYTMKKLKEIKKKIRRKKWINSNKSNIKFERRYTPITIIEKEIYNRQINKNKNPDRKKIKEYEFKTSKEKDAIRPKIIKYIQDGDVILMLESPELSALKEIEKQDIKPKKIIIPNDKEFKKLCLALNKYKTKLNIEVVNTSALQYLSDTSEIIDWIWLDYCGAFGYYKKDLEVLLKKFKKIRLVVTYNLFDLEHKSDNYYFTEVIDYVLEHSRDKVRIIKDISYRYKKFFYNIGFLIGNKQ